MSEMKGWNVFVGQHCWIDCVYFRTDDPQYVYEQLVRHDGFPADIFVEAC